MPSQSRFGREVSSKKWEILLPPCLVRTSGVAATVEATVEAFAGVLDLRVSADVKCAIDNAIGNGGSLRTSCANCDDPLIDLNCSHELSCVEVQRLVARSTL